MKNLFICGFALCTVLAEARVVNVADHGIVPGKDATYALNRLIESVQNEPDVTLSFPKGQYDFHPENALGMHRAVANHDNGLKRMAFPLFNHKNITIDGGGSTFMFHGHMIPFTIESVQGITLKNFSIDWIRSFHDEMLIVESNAKDKSVVVECDPSVYPYTIKGGKILFHRYKQDDPIGSNMVFDPETRAPIYNTRLYTINGKNAKITPISKTTFKIEKGFKNAPPVGSILVTYGNHPTSRLCPAIHVTNSKDLKIKNVTVYEAGGMGLIVERTDNITLDGMKVTSTKERIVSTRADATHFIGCKGTIKVENCLFEHMLDDAINVHGAYVPVTEYLGNNEFLCDISHFQQWGLTFGEPGDKIAILSRETILPFYETTVKNIKVLNEHRFVLTVTDVPANLSKGPLSVENLSWYPDLVFRKNIVRENRARSILVTTKGKVLIEDNYLSSQMHGILIEGDNNKWYESGAVQDVTIRNNEFVNIGYAVSERYPLLASPLFTANQRMGEGRYHRNIDFVDNTIKSFNGLLVKACSVKGLNISGNKMVFSTDYPKADEGEAIVLEYCDDVTIKKNKAAGFDNPLEVSKTADTSNVKIERNPGFKSQTDRKLQAALN
ncbi:right-handed parallel beta-helix repeat-containing protein [Pontiella sulfatireligans]|uniref:Alpha-1,3-galactosidase B n=1 Tax=Pontiella sulfatireligans TaxID=2750658 RepID=A0A6C2UKI3_9BACT|nr:right-handed parallel beta-helix repeat-containing protein [Pontiella sulfatireligans]VGO20479.1 Alpha-1,3-galactosidase B [Pontiella sulfatireligans]